jgi:hypothetical protein
VKLIAALSTPGGSRGDDNAAPHDEHDDPARTMTDWLPRAGDPTPLGWLTLAAYLLAALACGRAGVASLRRRHGRLAAWWFGAGLLMLVLGLNKELDLQTPFGQWGKQIALAQGWYEQRGAVQRGFVAGLAAVALAALALAAHALRDVWRTIAPALAGVALVLAYALLRAALFHVLRKGPYAPLLTLLWPLELAGIGLVAWGAWRTVPR